MKSIGVKELKQNASRVLADVEKHGACVVTVAGRPVATLSPTTQAHRWVPTTEMMAVFSRGSGAVWDDISEHRDAAGAPQDPFLIRDYPFPAKDEPAE